TTEARRCGSSCGCRPALASTSPGPRAGGAATPMRSAGRRRSSRGTSAGCRATTLSCWFTSTTASTCASTTSSRRVPRSPTAATPYDLSRTRIAAADFDGDHLTDLLSFYWYNDGSVHVHLFNGAKSLAFTDANGVATFAPFTIPWLQTQIVAGDWNGDGFGDLATLTSLDDGSTHVGVLRSNPAFVGGPRALQWSANQWVTAATDVVQPACTACWPLTGIATSSALANRRVLAVKIDN